MIRFFLKNTFLVASGLTAGMILAGHFWIGLAPVVNLAISLTLGAGVYLLGSSWWDYQVNREVSHLEEDGIKERVARAMLQAARIRGLAGTIKDPLLRAKLMNIVDLADRMLRSFASDPGDPAQTGRLLVYLDRFLPLVERYAHLNATPEGRELMLKSTHGAEFWELLIQAEEHFSQGFQQYLAKDATKLRDLGQTLKKMSQLQDIAQ